jgi:hypothetical protein
LQDDTFAREKFRLILLWESVGVQVCSSDPRRLSQICRPVVGAVAACIATF